MQARKLDATLNLGTARCGRCAQILPDETLTYCLACGVPFSKVPPTNTYQLLQEKSALHSYLRPTRRAIGAMAMVGFFLWCFSALFLELRNQAFLAEFQALRPLKVYFEERSEFPQIGRALAEASIAVARQSFRDHFRFDIPDIVLQKSGLPRRFEFVRKTKWDFNFGSLGFWSHFSNDNFTERFFQNPSQDVTVLMSNFPVHADADNQGVMELRHLGPEALVSGLSHPAFILVSSYRMNTQVDRFAAEGVTLKTFEERARFLGEYVLAHELGHSLLGLEDVVYPGHSGTRAPASEGVFFECLMHSDAGGGYRALAELQHRELGRSSRCQQYNPVIEAFALRSEAFRLLRTGQRQIASEKHREALRLIQGRTQPWVKRVWEKEASFFDSSFRRWIRSMFMFQ